MCTSIMAGRRATAGGLVLLSRNEDFTRNNWDKYMVYRDVPQYGVPATPSVAEGTWTLGNGLAVPVPDHAYSYSAMPDAAGATEAPYGIGDHFFFEERGINSHNVAISATNSMSTNARASAADPFVAVGVAESVMPTLVLPQAASARAAVQLLGGYVEKYGASEPNGVLLGDTGECWYLEIASGHHWLAVRVPDDSYVAVANGLRIHGVDLDDPGTLHSPGLYEFVVAHQLLGRPDRASFNFAKAFGVLGVDYNVDREWLAQKLLTPSLDQPVRQPQYPLFLAPDVAITVAEVMTVLRATYEGTVLAGKAHRPIGYEKTAESHIITLDAGPPAELAGTIWQAISTPLGAPYLPLYNAMREIPAGYALGANRYSWLSAYWAFHGAHALQVLLDQVEHIATPEWWAAFEQGSLTEAPLLSAALAQIYATDKQAAVDMAARASTGLAAQAVDLARAATCDLMTGLANDAAQVHATTIWLGRG
jgi:dipeptidase